MNTSKIACYTKPDEAPVLTPAESIIRMFEHTDENGVLYIPEWPVPLDDSAEDKELFYKCKMHWNAADLQDVLMRCESDYHALKLLSEKYDSIRTAADAEALPEAQKAAWNTYIRDFETGDIDAEAEARIGGGVAAYDVLFHAYRLYRLMSLSAPQFIIQGEACLFAQTMVIHSYCETMEVVEDVE